jgi:hypothetical protein
VFIVTSTIRSRVVAASLVASALLMVAIIPSTAEAQRRTRRGTPVVVIGGYGYYHHWMYDPWYQWGRYGYPPYGYRYGVQDLTASIRIDAEPRQAQVFVDGYYAGVVDEFDGVFQRLRVEPGGRTISIFLEGYRTEEQRLYLRPGTDQRLRLTLEPLASGERSQAPAPPSAAVGQDDQFALPDDRRMGPDAETGPGARAMPPPRERGVQQAPTARFGTLSLRVRPSDAEVFIDGERWAGSTESDAILIQLSEGPHRVEVRRDGMATYEENVLIRRDRTMTLNVSLR